MAKLLVVDDEPSICWGLSELGKRLRHEVFTASSAEAGIELAQRNPPDAILLDVCLPGMDGFAALPRLKELAPTAPLIVMTAYGRLSVAVEAVQQGAFDYVAKPFDLTHIEQVIARALSQTEAAATPALQPESDGLIGQTPIMQEVFKRVALVASSDACVMLQGESGTGKELVARAIHRYSHRSGGPFVAVNIAALNPALAESELFGHVRGAFTGADQPRMGLLAQADGGTLFLDEVADIPLDLQVKLLRALERGEVTPVGSETPVPARFRIVTATHQHLEDNVRAKTFRHDLYYRISTFRIDLPPLRDRREDILPLVEHFLRGASAHASGAPQSISHQAIDELIARQWHGNVRELKSAVEHAVVLAQGGVIQPYHLPPPMPRLHGIRPEPAAGPATSATSAAGQLATLMEQWSQQRLRNNEPTDTLYDEMLSAVEPPFLAAVLKKHHGQCASAARVLGMHRTTLKKKLDQYGIVGDE